MSQVVVYCNSTDCWADKENNFGNTEDYLYIIDSPGVTNSNVRNWIPFTINLRSVTIEQAYLTVTYYANSTQGEGSITLACEDADNPSAPVNGADLNGRTVTSFTELGDVPSVWTALDTKTWQMDNPVQEVLSRPGWKAGNTLAVILYDYDLGDGTRQIYSSRGAGGIYRAYLTLNFTSDIPNILSLT